MREPTNYGDSSRPPTLLLFDIGGVVLTNGWDRHARARAVERFALDGGDYAERHEAVSTALETGRISLDDYLESTVFHRARGFSRAEFLSFMHEQSQPLSDTFSLLDDLMAVEGLLLATLNNESRELNQYRIDKFGLRRYFDLFLTSSYLGVMKPDDRMFTLALDLTQRPAEEALFVDDRAHNVEAAEGAGVPAIEFTSAADLRRELHRRGMQL